MRFDIVIDEKLARAEINRAIREMVLKFLNKSFISVEDQIRSLIQRTLEDSPAYRSMISGVLRGELGLIDAKQELDQIINILKGYVKIKKDYAQRGQTLGGLQIDIMEVSHSEILTSSAATYKSNGYDIDWLEWLLVRDGELIIRDYRIQREGTMKNSRTKEAIMVRGTSGWRMPDPFKGSLGNNWIVNALTSSEFETNLDRIISNEIVRRF